MLQSKWITTAVPHPQPGEVSFHSRQGRSVIGVRPSVPSRWASPRALLTPGLSAQLGKGLPPFLARRAGRVTRRPPVWSPLTHGPHPTTPPCQLGNGPSPLWTTAHLRMVACPARRAAGPSLRKRGPPSALPRACFPHSARCFVRGLCCVRGNKSITVASFACRVRGHRAMTST